jgi:hypothetical protein
MAGVPELERCCASGQDLIWRQDTTFEASVALIMSDAYMNLAAFEQGRLLGTKGFAQFHMDVGKALSVSR